MGWRSRFKSWEGTVGELEQALQNIPEELTWIGPAPSVRLLRHYTQLGILERPVRRGREAWYGHRHVVQYVAARWLIHDGWPLAKIAEVTAVRTTEELLDLIPDPTINAAQRLIQQFKQTSTPSPSLTQQKTRLLQQRVRTQQALPQLGNLQGVVPCRTRLQLELTSWCHILIDEEEIKKLAQTDIQQLGDALITTLTEAIQKPTPRPARRPAKGKKQ